MTTKIVSRFSVKLHLMPFFSEKCNQDEPFMEDYRYIDGFSLA